MTTPILFRPAVKRVSALSNGAIALNLIQPVAGPSRLAAMRCSCGELLTDGVSSSSSNSNRKRWISSSTSWNARQTAIAMQVAASAATSTLSSTSPSSAQPPPPLPLSAFNQTTSSSSSNIGRATSSIDKATPPPATVEAPPTPPAAKQPAQKSRPARREIKAQKAAITLTPTAVEQLLDLLDSPTPKLIRIGVRNKGCAGMAYHLEYVDKPGKFDEVIEQDGVKVLIDSKALFSIVGSEMDWQEDKISSKFVFKNPNIKEQCGCGESFLT